MNNQKLGIVIALLSVGFFFLTSRKSLAATHPGAPQMPRLPRPAPVPTPTPAPAPKPKTVSTSWGEISKAFQEAEYHYGVPAGVLKAMANIESAFRPEIISGQVKGASGEIGIMQITPRWHPNVDPYNPIASIWYAAGWLRDLYKRFGDWKLAVAAYNWGPTNLSNKGFAAAPIITKTYVARVANVTGI